MANSKSLIVKSGWLGSMSNMAIYHQLSTIQAQVMTEQEKLRAKAEFAVDRFSSLSNLHEAFGYNSASVKWFDEFIEQERVRSEATFGRATLIQIIGSYLGECIIQTYGGTWKESDGQWGVFFDDSNAVFPFAKVTKQFQCGHCDSIFSFFDVIPLIFFNKGTGTSFVNE